MGFSAKACSKQIVLNYPEIPDSCLTPDFTFSLLPNYKEFPYSCLRFELVNNPYKLFFYQAPHR